MKVNQQVGTTVALTATEKIAEAKLYINGFIKRLIRFVLLLLWK